MEGRVRLDCSDCGRTAEIAGEIPEEFRRSFLEAASSGWVPRPGPWPAWLCGECLPRYEGSESRDDAQNIAGFRPR